MAKANPKTDLSGLLGAANRSKDVLRPRVDETLVSQDMPTQVAPTLEEPPERRVNVAVRDSVHRPLRLYSVKVGRQVRDLVEEAVLNYLKQKGEIEQ